MPVSKFNLVCACRSVRRAAQDVQRINRLYVLTPLTVKLIHRSARNAIKRYPHRQWLKRPLRYRKWWCLSRMTCRHASWLSIALAGDATERASQGSWEMSISVKALARPHTRVPTLTERPCRQRVHSAACLAPPIGSYTLFQPIKVKKAACIIACQIGVQFSSIPNDSMQEHSVAQSRDRILDASVIFCGYHFKL